MKAPAWFRRKGPAAPPAPAVRKVDIPEGLWTKCEACGEVVFERALEENLRVCPKCGFHFPLGARARVVMLVDDGSFREADAGLRTVNALDFPNYTARLEKEREKTGTEDAVVTGMARIAGRAVSLAVMDFQFLGGSMGVVVGEKIARAGERALARKAPFVAVCASGGARMHEGALSLMQMAKISGVLHKLARAGLPFVVVLTNPTMGGVTASFATLGDLILAEPGAMVGFAGPRVIKETTHQDLPKGFQTAEFLMERGLVDRIVPRRELRAELERCLAFLSGE